MNTKLLNRLPIGTVGFEKIRDGLIYVDKTALIFPMASKKSAFFLARPRRFGKSLLVNTLKSLFSKGLVDFEGLAIEKLWEDKTYPVCHLDFSTIKAFGSSEEFSRKFTSFLQAGFMPVGFKFDSESTVSIFDQLSLWMKSLPASSLVILVDEYDAPLTAHLDEPEVFKEIRERLSSFYATIKGNENALRFFFMTGITKFKSAGIFSELNNITDITMSPQFGELLGLTRREIETYFAPYVSNASEILGISFDEVMDRLERHYDGYVFERSCQHRVFAPWSVLNFLSDPASGFLNYWYESAGQPTVLLKYLSDHGLVNPSYYAEPKMVSLSMLNASQVFEKMQRETLLTQTGYLTLKKVLSNGMCLLGYPNEEVAQSMAQLFAEAMLESAPFVMARMSELPRKLASGNVGDVVEYLNAAFKSISYQNYPVKSEATCAMCVQILFIGASLVPAVEVQNAYGRSDLEVSYDKRHWVFEFKFLPKDAENQEKGAEELLAVALSQIHSKHYGEQRATGRELKRAALVFSEKSRCFVRWAEA